MAKFEQKKFPLFGKLGEFWSYLDLARPNNTMNNYKSTNLIIAL